MSCHTLPRRGALASLVALPAPLSAAFAQTCPEFQDIGTLGGSWAKVVALSADGSAIFGESQDASGRRRAYRWTEQAGMQDLGTFGGPDAFVTASSGDGHVAVGLARGTGAGLRAFVWTEGSGMSEILPPIGSTFVEPTSVSRDGSVVVGYYVEPGLGEQAFTWTATSGVTRIDVPGSPVSLAEHVSADGVVVVVKGISITEDRYTWTAAGGAQLLCNDPCGVSAMSESGHVIAGGFLGAGWVAHTAVWPQGPVMSYSFPSDMSPDGSTIVGGKAVNGSAAGCCWTEQQAYRWTPPSLPQELGTLGGNRGRGTAVSADGRVVVGADHARNSTGGIVERAFVWTEGGGMRDVGAPGDLEAEAIGVSDDGRIVVGRYVDAAGNDRVFRVEVSPSGRATCRPAATNSAGCGAFLVALGSVEIAANTLELEGVHLPPSSTAFALVSRQTAVPVQPGGSQGTLCLGGSIGRFVGPGEVQDTGVEGTFHLGLDLGALPSPTGSLAALPGETWHFQVWYRDANPGPTSNFTNAVSVALE